jgi:hypothetical protein
MFRVEADEMKKESASLVSMMRKPRILLNLAIAFLSFANMGYTDVTMAKHMNTVKTIPHCHDLFLS